MMCRPACGWGQQLSSDLLTISTFCCSGSLEKQTVVGNTPLHYCCTHNKPECLKLLLKAKASIAIGEWPWDP